MMNRFTVTAILAIGLLSSACCAREVSFLANGGFDSGAGQQIDGWQAQMTDAQLTIQPLSDIWRRCTVTFHSGPYTRINLCFGLYSWPSGRVWIDNVQSSGFIFQNPSFEEGLAHWSVEGVGKWTSVSDERAFDGKNSVLVFPKANDAPMIRFYQTVDVKPNTDYSYTFDFYAADDFYGAIRTAGWSVLPEKGVRVPCGETPFDEILARRALAGRRTVQIDLQDGQARLTQALHVPAGRHLQVSALVDNRALDGQFHLRIENTKDDAVLAQTSLTDRQQRWQRVGVRFVSPAENVRFTIEARGKGRVVIDQADVSPPVLTPPVQEIVWRPAVADHRLGDTLAVSVAGAAGQLLETGLTMLGNDLAALADISIEREGDERGALDIHVGSGNAPNKGPESYALTSHAGGIRISASHERGAFYGLVTLLQLLDRSADGRPVVMACDIRDWPDMPWREVTRPSGISIERFARLKYNRLTRTSLAQMDEYKRFGIEPVVHVNITQFPDLGLMYRLFNLPKGLRTAGQSLGPIDLSLNVSRDDVIEGQTCSLRWCEGQWVRDESLELRTGPVQLAGRNVLRGESTDIVVRSSDGLTTYVEGADYRIVPGELAYPVNDDAVPFAIERVPQGRIASGQTVLASYDHLRPGSSGGHLILCLAEPEVWDFYVRVVTALVRQYDLNYLACHVSEEPDWIGQDSRCRDTGLSRSQLLANIYHKLDAAIKQARPGCRLVSWADNFPGGSTHNLFPDILALLPKDMILINWAYHGSVSAMGLTAARQYHEHALEFVACPWYDPVNIRQWTQVVSHAGRQGWPGIGLRNYGPAPKYAGMPDGYAMTETAICSWKMPRPGDRRWTPLPIEVLD